MKYTYKTVPESPAYLVYHDAYHKGAMEVWLLASFERAEIFAKRLNEKLDKCGLGGAGTYRAYAGKLPRKSVWKVHLDPAANDLVMLSRCGE